MKKMRFITAWLGILSLVGYNGCVGYRLGSMLPSDIKTVYVRMFVNKSNEPLIEIDATNATIAEFQKDGTLRIVQIDEADVILECTLTGMTLTALRYDQQDKAKPNEYRMTLSCNLVLKRAHGHSIINEASVVGETTFYFAGNLTSAKKSAVPSASEDLAKRIVEKVVETW